VHGDLGDDQRLLGTEQGVGVALLLVTQLPLLLWVVVEVVFVHAEVYVFGGVEFAAAEDGFLVHAVLLHVEVLLGGLEVDFLG